MAQPMRGDLPYPEGSTGGPQPQIERPVGKRRARISCKHKLRRREGDSAGSHDPAAFKFLLEGLPLEERCTQASGNGHILEDASLALDPESDDFLPHPLAIGPSELDQFLEPASGLEKGVGQVEREGGAVALLPDHEIVEEPSECRRGADRRAFQNGGLGKSRGVVHLGIGFSRAPNPSGNMKAQLDWTDKMYGRQSDHISDYTDLNLHQKLDDPPMQTLRAWVDPYSYRRSYTMPKLLLLGTNDPYWVVDSLRHYWSDLPEPKLVFQTPNAGHDLGGGHDAWQTLAAWFQMIADRQLLPKVEWQLRDGTDGAAGLTIRVDQPANKVRLWTAHSADRDFRDEKWTSRELEIQPGSSQASADVPKPAAGFTAFLAEVELTAPTGQSYKLSTQVQVTPDGVNRWP